MSFWGDIGSFLSNAFGSVEHAVGIHNGPTPQPQAQPQPGPQLSVQGPQAGPQIAQQQAAQQVQQAQQAQAFQAQQAQQRKKQQQNPNFIQSVGGFVKKDIVNPIRSADAFIANSTGLTDAAKASGVIPATQKQRLQSAKNLVTGAVKFPVQAGQQIGNTLQQGFGYGEAPKGTAPPLQTQFRQIKKTNGTLPAVLETGFQGAMDVAPLLGSGIKTAKVAGEIPKNEIGAVGKNVNPEAPKPNVPEVPTYYHGGTPIDKNAIAKSDLGYSVTTNKNVAKWFTNTKDGSNITEHTISPKAKVLQSKDIPQELKDNYGALDPNKSVLENLQSGPARLKDAERKLVAYARSKGYDAIDMRGHPFVIKGNGVLDNEAELRVLNPKIINDKPLTPPTQGVKNNVALSNEANPGTSLQPAPELPLKLRSETKNPPTGTKLLQNQEINKPAPSSVNYSKNPTNVDIPQVNPGDYGKARSNAQLASAPIEYSAGQVARIARNENMTTSKLGRLVEGTDKPANNAEVEAIRRYRQFADRVHATSQALGGNTPYRPNYFHHEWDLSDPNAAAKFEQFRQRKFGKDLDPTQFEGLDTQPRVFDTIAEGEKAGFKLKNPDAATDILDYGKGSAYALKRQALAKGFLEADGNEVEKPHSFDIGQGKTLALSDRGLKEIRAFEKTKEAGTPLKIYRGSNRKLKQTLLSASEFHPINITKKVAPAIALKGHPVLATKGAYGAFRAQIGRGYSDALQQSFQEKGLVDFGARVGSPIKFGSDYESEGHLDLGKAGFGEKTIFEKSMPALHGRALEALQADLDKKGISYDSPEARAAGTRINEMMGFVNTEVRNLDKGHQKFLGDIALAPQFTRAKWATIKSALKDKGVAGSYARRAVIGDTLATATVMLALGYLANQKSDNIKDLLIRALVHPSVPTPMKDSKGNTIELGLPSTYTSEALGLAANIKRGKDGHLGIDFKPANIGGNLENYGRARLAIIPGSGLKIATNTDYAGKPLFNPNAPAGTKAIQGGTTLLGGTLPIGTQGILETNAVKKHLPQSAQDVLTANTPGTNPFLKSAASSFGLTPRTDKTVGKGLQTNQYFSALDYAKKGLNSREAAALELYSGSKKNPVTGKYDIMPTVFDQPAKANALLQNPKVIDNLISMNKTLVGQGQKVDPLWQQSKDHIVKYLQYETMPPGGPDQANWRNQNPWYDKDANSLYTQRNNFFNSLPPGDPNKPKAPIEYPKPDNQTTNDMNTWSNMLKSDPNGAEQFLLAHQNVQTQLDNQAAYTNAVRVARGYGALRTYPTPPPQVQAKLDALPKGNDKASKKARALVYNQPDVASWMQQDAVYNLTKNAALAQIQGNPLNSKALSAVNSLRYDLVKNPDGTYGLKYPDVQGGNAVTAQSGATAISGSGSSKSGSGGGSSHYLRLNLDFKPNKLKVANPRHIRTTASRDYIKYGKVKQKPYFLGQKKGKLPISTF